MKQGFLFISLTLSLTFTFLVSCTTFYKKQSRLPMNSCPKDFKEVSLSPLNWKIEYSGYGKIEFSPSTNEIYIAPLVARTPQSTHASLVLSKFTLEDNFDIIVEYKNNQALRTQNPNPWEVFWLFFQYKREPSGGKSTNYVIAKPNGIELGKASGQAEQQFLNTVNSPKASFNEWHQIRIKKKQQIVAVYFDEQKVFDMPSDSLFQHKGHLGLYSEDASVTIRKVCSQ